MQSLLWFWQGVWLSSLTVIILRPTPILVCSSEYLHGILLCVKHLTFHLLTYLLVNICTSSRFWLL